MDNGDEAHDVQATGMLSAIVAPLSFVTRPEVRLAA
jgi:hypothetical protein